MLDIKWIRQNAVAFDQAMKSRANNISSTQILALDEKKRKKTAIIEELQAKRNKIAKQIAEAKRLNSATDELFNQSKQVALEMEEMQKESKDQEDSELENILATIPNIPESGVPVGKDESNNIELEKFGKIRQFDFAPKQHFEIGENLGMLDFKQSSLMSGARFSTLSGDLAHLERALSNFMLDVAIEFGYTEVSPPNLVKSKAMYGSGQLPKFAAEAFHTQDDYWLIPTSEVSLVNLFADKILDESQLPIRLTAHTPCYRSEAGAAGKDTRGMIRQHQFKKVELVSITTGQDSNNEHERMTNIASEVLIRLDLPFRKIMLCTGDIGFCSAKTYDLEVWLPGQNQYREISSCSNCTDFQARRLNTRYKSKSDSKNYLVHTLNGSSLAVGRTIVAILENYQNNDGSVTIPEVLVKYMKNKTTIKRS